MSNNKTYLQFVQEVKQQILQSRLQAARLVNRELLLLYYHIGKMIAEKVEEERWGSAVIDSLSRDIQQELPGIRGFSSKNLRNMRLFFEAYYPGEIWQSATAKIKPEATGPNWQLATAEINKGLANEVFTALSFTHHILLLNKCKDLEERSFYIQLSVAHHWTVTLLQHHIDSDLYRQKGKLPNNFNRTLPQALAGHALDAFKDEYLLDFINISPDGDERVLETEIVNNIKHFILSLGTGFSFMGNQFRLVVEEEEFFCDLLFFNRQLQCLVAIELKKGKFKPEYAGQLNFYLNVLDEQVKLPHENNSIGIILCKEKTNKVVEYAFKSMDKAMGVATYKTSKQLPVQYKKILPGVEELKKLLQ
jgi:predicted nuclease of restriction endonuclease-like (RecB) superfamily